MKWFVLLAALAASTCLWLAPVSGVPAGEVIDCGAQGPTRTFPVTPITLVSGLTEAEAIALAEDDEWLEHAIYDFFKWEFGDKCAGCEVYEGHPKPVGPPCNSLYTFDPGDGEDAGVEVEIIQDEATGTFSVVVKIAGGATAWIYCTKDC